MKTFSALEAKNKFGQLLEAAQRQPVTVTKKGRASVVVMSVSDYERRKQYAWKNLLKTLDETSESASAQGLTSARLKQLLNVES